MKRSKKIHISIGFSLLFILSLVVPTYAFEPIEGNEVYVVMAKNKAIKTFKANEKYFSLTYEEFQKEILINPITDVILASTMAKSYNKNYKTILDLLKRLGDVDSVIDYLEKENNPSARNIKNSERTAEEALKAAEILSPERIRILKEKYDEEHNTKPITDGE